MHNHIPSYTPIPGPGDFCAGCNRLVCGCRPGPDHDGHYDRSYEAGYAHCLIDGYDDRPGTEYIYRSGCYTAWDAAARQMRHHMMPVWFVELTWRCANRTVCGYRRWFEHEYGYDLELYLAGYDDAGSGLPSAVASPEAHARAAAALGAYELLPCEPETVLVPYEVASVLGGLAF